MACGTSSQFAKNVSPSEQHSPDIVEIAALDDLDDAKSYRSGVSSLLRTRLGVQREQGGWHSSPDLFNSEQNDTSRYLPSRCRSPPPNPTDRRPVAPQGSEFRATTFRDCWTTSKIHQMSIACLEWHGSADDNDHFLLMQIVSAPTTRSKNPWVRLERRSKHSSVRSLMGQTKSLLGHIWADDVVVLSCNKRDLVSKNGSFEMKETIEESIPFSFMLDVIDLAHKNLASNANDSWMYASFIMEAVHQFCEPVSPMSDASSVQANNPHCILRKFADNGVSESLKHEIELQHDWELL
ncbi:hypothetical protein RhiLY_12447 [Ceratobasidium sp. AG-Ba]|nr:hypothetical protein RhiLY_12447 [Ceratobasidium sp. AG-Ba]